MHRHQSEIISFCYFPSSITFIPLSLASFFVSFFVSFFSSSFLPLSVLLLPLSVLLLPLSVLLLPLSVLPLPSSFFFPSSFSPSSSLFFLLSFLLHPSSFIFPPSSLYVLYVAVLQRPPFLPLFSQVTKLIIKIQIIINNQTNTKKNL